MATGSFVTQNYSRSQSEVPRDLHNVNWLHRMTVVHAGNNSYAVGDRLTNTFTKDFLCLDNEYIFGGDQGDTPEMIEEILTTARDLESEVNEDDIEELIMGHEDELTIEELQEILNEERQETAKCVSF
ncbi:hypothetical protein TNCV_1730041 [Trichonephila clavipes]|nr:hypothetical protein TNCV_1730041 [Trichonephila clavipes]